MKKLRFKPRSTFNADLKRLANLDKTIIDEIRAGLHERLFPGQNCSKRYRKNDE